MRMIVRGVLLGAAVAAITMAWPDSAMAIQQVPVPEIDGSSMATGLSALSAGVLILRSYFGKR